MEDIAESSKHDINRITVNVSFFNSEADIVALKSLREGAQQTRIALLIESPVMFEAIRPFLQALTRPPSSFPFAQYLGHPERGTFLQPSLEPPEYTRAPGFCFDLSCLLKPESGAENCDMEVQNLSSVDAARALLKECSRLDPSQCDAVVNTLCRSVALIQG
jgi:hypothetical protein